MEGLENMRPEDMAGSPWHEEYTRIAPNPEGFATLFAKKTQMDREIQDLPAEYQDGRQGWMKQVGGHR
jgi:hypothetical protein